MTAAAARFADTLAELIRDALRGERALRLNALTAFLARSEPKSRAALMLVGGIRTEFRLIADAKSTDRFLWYRHSETKPIADLRVRLQLALENDDRRRSIVRPRLLLVTPPFLFPHSNDTASELAVANGRIDAHFSGTDEMVVRGPIGHRELVRLADDLDRSEYVLTSPSMNWVIPVLNTIEQWKRGDRQDRAQPFEATFAGSLTTLVQAVTDGCGALASALEEPDTGTEPPSPAGKYVIAAGSAEIRVYLANDGSLMTSRGPKSESQQVDLHIELAEDSDGPLAILAFDLPDFLVDGPVHARILQALGSAESHDAIADAFRTAGWHDGLDHDELQKFLTLPGHAETALLIRTSQDLTGRGGSDSNLMLLEGTFGNTSAHILLLAEVDVPAPEDRPVTIRSPLLLGWQFGDSSWQAGHGSNQVKHYLYRLLRTLHGFQLGLRAAAANTAPDLLPS